MKLNVTSRTAGKKSDAKQSRLIGKIPAIIYQRGKNSENILVDNKEYQTLIRQTKKGHLPTTRITLVSEDGKETKAIIKEIQYHITTYDVLHLDFEELVDDVKVKVKIPIECTGVVDCVGIKLGGVLRQVIRHMRVQCLPKDMPESFTLDVQNLELNDSLRLNDLTIPSTIRPLMKLEEVAIVIAKR